MPISVQLSEALTSGTMASNNMVTITQPGPDGISGDMTITASGARPDTGGEEDFYRHTTDMEVNDYEVEATVAMPASVTSEYYGVIARCSADAETRIVFETFGSATQVRCLVVLNGTLVQEAYASVSVSTNTDHKLKLRVVGSSISCLFNDVQVLNFSNTAVLSGTRCGIKAYTDNVASCAHLKAFAARNYETGVVPPGDPDPTPDGAVDAVFTVVGDRIIDPNGRRFIPVGMNGFAAARPVPASTWWQTNYDYLTGHVQELIDQFGINCLRVFPTYDHTSSTDFANAMRGLDDLIAEATELGIVCIVTMLSVNATNGFNPANINDLPPAWVQMQDHLCANHANNPYVWIGTAQEAWSFMDVNGGNAGSGWALTCNQLYTRARQRGWTGIQVFTLAQYGQQMELASRSNVYYNFVAGKENVVLDFHNYGGDAGEAALVNAVRTMQGRGVAIIVGEFGEHWNAENGAVAFSTGDTAGTLWVRSHAFEELKIGGLAWIGASNHFNPFSLRQNFTREPSDTSTVPINTTGEGYGRAAYMDDVPMSRVGTIVATEGAKGVTVNGGGVYTGTGGGGGGGTGGGGGGGAGGIAEFYEQNFNTGATAADVGMSESFGGMTLVAGRVRTNAVSDPGLIFVTIDARAQNDHYAEIDVKINGAMDDGYAGVIARANEAGDTRYQFELYAGATTQARLMAIVNATDAAEYYFPATFALNTTYRFRIECVGSEIVCYIDGVEVYRVTDTTIPTGLRTGAKVLVDTNVANIELDNFETGSWPEPTSGGGGGGSTGSGTARTTTPTVRRWRVSGYPVPPSVRQWIVPLLVHTRTSIDGVGSQEQNLNVEDELDFITELQQSRRAVTYREGTRSYRVRVDGFQRQSVKWSDDGEQMESTIIVKLIEA